MKSDSNTEMDSLLRRHARREGVPVYGAADTPTAASTGRTSAGPHLDADEMNAYTEGKLPAPVRARYVSHLADCDKCSGIVSALALAANIQHEDHEREARPGALPKSSWREWLAALFAPPMIRYGAAALVLLCAAGVVFVAMRQQQASRQKEEPALVARTDQREAESASAVRTEPGQQPSSPLTPASPVVPGGEASPAEAAKAKSPARETGADTVTEQEANGPTTNETARADQPLSATTPSLSRDPAQQRAARDEDLVVAKTVPAAPAAEISPSTSRGRERSEVDEMTQSRKDEVRRDEGQAATGIVGNTSSARESEETVAAGRRPPAATEARRARSARRAEPKGSGADVGASGGGAAGKPAEETRSVGGREFRRQGGVWVDRAYTSGRAVVQVTRGSEQYRALVSDEPTLRAIADQLGGEVIVVWKGRAYRIR
jgi:hypothetical protein